MSAKIKAAGTNNDANKENERGKCERNEEEEKKSDQFKKQSPMAEKQQTISSSVTRPNSTDNNKISPQIRQRAKAQTKVVTLKENRSKNNVKHVESKAGVKRKLNEVVDVKGEGKN